jgi:hypothetical protein
VFDRQGDKVIVPTYVDVLHITAKTTDAIQRVKEELGKHFKLHDLGPTKWFLGIHIIRDRSKHTLSLSQHQAVKHIFCYIQGTIDYRLTYGPSPHPTNFLTYSDADYAGDTDSSKSTSGYALLMGGAAVAWSSKL